MTLLDDPMATPYQGPLLESSSNLLPVAFLIPFFQLSLTKNCFIENKQIQMWFSKEIQTISDFACLIFQFYQINPQLAFRHS